MNLSLFKSKGIADQIREPAHAVQKFPFPRFPCNRPLLPPSYDRLYTAHGLRRDSSNRLSGSWNGKIGVQVPILLLGIGNQINHLICRPLQFRIRIAVQRKSHCLQPLGNIRILKNRPVKFSLLIFLPFSYTLRFHCSVCQSADNILLHENKNQNNRRNRYDSKGHRRVPESLILLNIIINTGSDGPHIGICDKGNSVNQISPCIYKRKHCRHYHPRPGNGKHNPEKGLPVPAAVNVSRLVQFLGNGEKVRSQDNNTEGDSQRSVPPV